MGEELKVVVVGGGISGLSTSYFLKKLTMQRNQNIHLTLIEAQDRLGGKIATDVKEHLIIEGGPDSIFTLKPYALDLIRDLGLESELIGTNPETKGTYVLNHGKLSKLPEGTETGVPTKLLTFLETDLLSFPGKVRAIMDIFIAKKRGNSDEDESIGSFIGRRFGKEFLEKIVEPLYAGIYAGDVYQLSSRSVLPRLVEMESKHRSLMRGMRNSSAFSPTRKKKGPSSKHDVNPTQSPRHTFVTLKGGLTKLVERISSTSLDPSSIMLNTSVKEISESNGNTSKRFCIEIEGEERSPIEADVVVLSTPAYLTAQIIRRMDSTIATLLGEIPYVSTATVSLAFRKGDFDSVKGHGFLVPRTEGEMITGCTWESSKWIGHAPTDVVLARCYFGWSGHEEFVKLGDDELIDKAKDFLRRTAHITAEPYLTKIFRLDRALPQYNVGHIDRISTLQQLLKPHRGLFLIGAAYRGVGIPDCIQDGRLTAEKIIETFKGG